MKNLLPVTLLLFFFSCQQKENKNITASPSDTVRTKETKAIKKEVKQEENKQKGDTIFLNFKNEKGLFVAEGQLDSTHSRIYLKFRNEDLGELNAKITPTTGKGNIRFNQIIFPDNTSDGPFGMDLKIALKQKGDNILVIGHSLMADNPYIGKFTVQLESIK